MSEELSSTQRELDALRAEIEALRLEEALLRADYDRLQQLNQRAPLGYQSLDENGCFLMVNQAWLDILGYGEEEVIGRNFGDFLHPAWRDHFRENFPRFKAIGEILGVEFEMMRRDGRTITVAFDGRIGRDPDGRFQQTHCIFRDITARRAEEVRREAERRLLRICQLSGDTRELVSGLVDFFQDLTGCEAVGIRLRRGEDFPYIESRGFSQRFLLTENFLCERTADGDVVRDASGNPVLECMCGNVLRGRFNPELPFFTPGGSFWTNSTSELLAATTETDRQARTRNRCNGEGYESVALIPFRLRGETFGLLQLNDPEKGRFSAELIGQIEELTAYVSLSLSKHLADMFRQETEEKYRLLVESAQEGVFIARNQRLLLVNPAAAKISGYSVEELRLRPFADLIHPDDLAMVVSRHQERLHGDEVPEIYSFRIVTGDGSVRWVEVNGTLISWEGAAATLNFVNDITERKRAEEALCASERLLNATQRLTRAGGWEWHVLNGTMTWTEETYRIHEFAPGEITLGSPVFIARSLACYRGEDRPVIEAAFRRCVEFGIPYDLEFPFTTATGRHIWIRTTAEPVWADGRIVKVVGNIVDITDQRRAAEKLRESEAAMRAILDAAQASIHLFDTGGTVLMANAVTADRFGLTVDELIGRNIFDLFPPEVAGRRREITRQIFDSGTMRIVSDQRQGRFFETSLHPVVDAAGRVSGIAVFSLDVTDRKMAEQALQASEERYRALFEYAPVAIWEEDFSAVKERIGELRAAGVADLRRHLQEHPGELAALAGMVRILDINRQSVRILGAAGKEDVYCDLPRYFTPRSLEVFADELAALAEGETRFEAEIPVVAVNGRPLLLRLTLSVDPGDMQNWSRVLVTFVDITEQKQNEQRLRQQAMILDQISDAVTVTDLDGVVTFINKASAEKLGRSIDELIGRHVEVLGHDPEYGASQQQIVAMTLAHGRWQGEVVNVTPDGRRVLMDCRVNTLFDEQGRKVGMCGISTDITEKRRTERLLQARLRLSEEASVLELDEFMQLALDEAEKLTGSRIGFFHFLEADQRTISLQAWSTATTRDFCRAEGKGLHYGLELAGVWADAIRRREPVIHEDVPHLPGLRKVPSGHAEVERELVVPVLRGGLITAVLGVGNKPYAYDQRDIELVASLADMVWDIVLRKRVEEALKASEERFRGIYEVSPAGIALADSATMRFLRANRSFLEIVGYTEEELRQKKVGELTHPDDWAEERNRLAEKRGSNTGEPYTVEKRYVRKDGGIRWVRLMADYLKLGDESPLLIANVVDITARREAEAALQQSLAEKEVLLREVHHRVKNNMAAIIGLFELQRQSLDDPTAMTVLAELSSRVRAMSLVHEKLYRSDSLSRIDFQEYLQSIVSHLRTSFGSPGIVCEIDAMGIGIPLDQAVPCGMIVNELVTNALKYAFPRDGVMHAGKEERIVVRLGHSGDEMVMTVADNGIGLPPGFDWRTSRSLGMVLVRTLGEHQLRGRYTVAGDQGVSFTLTFAVGQKEGTRG